MNLSFATRERQICEERNTFVRYPEIGMMQKPIQVLAIGIGLNLLWSIHPVLGKILLAEWDPWHVAWLRYTSAWVVWVFLLGLMRGRRVFQLIKEVILLKDGAVPLWIGLVTFCLTPLMQSYGLKFSGAFENAVLVALEPMSAVLLAVFLLKENLNPRQRFAFLAAVFGVFFLSDGVRILSGEVKFEASYWRVLGNALLVISLLGEGLYSAAGRLMNQRTSRDASWIFTAALTWGVIFLTVLVLPVFGLPHFDSLRLTSGLSLFWIGPIGTSFCYWLWLRLLQGVQVSFLSITLFIQPLAGAAFGWLLLEESLHFWKILGGVVILLAMMLSAMNVPSPEE
jgi:drug/metabolite transporter (DMT)-like permease